MGSPPCEWGRAKHGEDLTQVTLTHAFRLQEHETTQREWTKLGLPNPSGSMPDGTGDCLGDDCPVGNLTWFEAMAFANRRSAEHGLPECYELSGCRGEPGQGMACDAVQTTVPSVYDCTGYRLPTSAEWEYAARAGARSSVYSGEIRERPTLYTCYEDAALSAIGWYCNNAGPRTHPVGGKRKNAWGLYDMIGNAGEWVGSLAENDAQAPPPTIDRGAKLAATNLLAGETPVEWRGGAWNLWPHMLRAGAIARELPMGRGPGIGFRLAQTIARN